MRKKELLRRAKRLAIKKGLEDELQMEFLRRPVTIVVAGERRTKMEEWKRAYNPQKRFIKEYVEKHTKTRK